MFPELFNWLSGNDRTTSSELQNTGQSKDWLQDLLDNLLPKNLPVIPEAKFEDLIKWFVQQPRLPNVEKGAIMRRSHSLGILIVQVFLDVNNEVVCGSDGKPYGRKLIAKNLDRELWENFANKNIIIVE